MFTWRAPSGGDAWNQLSAVIFPPRGLRLHAQHAFVSFPSTAVSIGWLRRALSGQWRWVRLRGGCDGGVTAQQAASVRVALVRYRSLSGTALPYIPEAVPRLVFVDRRRDRVSASAAARGGNERRRQLRSSDDEARERPTLLPPKPASGPRRTAVM